MKKQVLATLAVALLATACSKTSDMALVKDGTLQFDESITVGQAFDAWGDCASREWEEFKTSNGKRVVQFSCVTKNAEPFAQKVQQSHETQYEFLQLSSMTSEFQWVINQDDSFEVTHTGKVWKWKDGKTFDMPEDPETLLGQVYNNETTFDLANLDDPQMAQVLNSVFAESLMQFHHAAK